MLKLGKELGLKLKPCSIVAISGDLGAGKTTLIKGIAGSAAHIDAQLITSPTFTLLNIYSGALQVYHFDLYRLQSAEDFLALGFDEVLDAGGICLIEWPEVIEQRLPERTLKIQIEYGPKSGRTLILL